MRFVRIKGRVVPIDDKKQRRYPGPKQVGIAKGGGIGAALGFGYGALIKPSKTQKVVNGFSFAGDGTIRRLKSIQNVKISLAKRSLKPALIGLAAGAVLGSLKFYKRAKGESQKHLANRAAK